MIFERKENNQLEQENTNNVQTYFWTLLKWYWLLIPSFYFMIKLPALVQEMEAAPLSTTEVSTLFFQILNYSMAANMFLMAPEEQSKKGVADKFLKIGLVQQFFVGDLIAIILIALAWYQLPKDLVGITIERDEKDAKVKPRTNMILVIITTLFSIAFAASRMLAQ